MVAIRMEHEREFDQDKLIDYCDKNDISHNYSTPKTPQQNGVIKRKNHIRRHGKNIDI